MKIAETLLKIHDGARLNGRDHFELMNNGYMDRAGKITAKGKAAMQPLLDARAEAKKKAK